MIRQYSNEQKSKQLSANFRVGEFGCKCGHCSQTLIDDSLALYLQQLRTHFGKPVNITSGYRCGAHNAAVGGTPGSLHLKGQAADIYISGVSPSEIAMYAESIGVLGIGQYDDFVHIDTRKRKSFWLGHEQAYRSTFGGSKEQTFTLELRYLRRGCEGEDVRALQAALKGHGCKIGADGIYGPATEKAVRAYQKNAGLDPDGVAGPDTRKHMLGI